MTTFITSDETPVLYEDKVAAPGQELPSGLSLLNVPRAVDFNVIKDALFDTREYLRLYHLATSDALGLYVHADGEDGAPGTAGAPLSIAGVEARLTGLKVRHPVNVTMLAGTYTRGLRLSNIQVEKAASATDSAYVNITGEFIAATLASGSVTGTFTAVSTGSGKTRGTATMTGAGWTVDDLRGKWVEITGGPGVGQIRPIQSNTATALTITGTWASTVPTTSSTFAIREVGTIVTGVGLSDAIPSLRTAGVGSPSARSAFFIDGVSNFPGVGIRAITVDRIRFTSACASPIQAYSETPVRIRWCRFENTTADSDGLQQWYPSGFLTLQDNSFSLPTGANVSAVDQPAGSVGARLDFNGNVVDGGGNILAFQELGYLTTQYNSVRGAARFVHWGVIHEGQCEYDDLDSMTAEGFRGDYSPRSNSTAGMLSIKDCDYDGDSDLVRVNGLAAIHVTGNGLATGAGGSVQVNEGASVKVASTTDFGAGSIIVEGTSYSPAELRALTPKRITDVASGSTVYEA